ncbi:MAG: GNAT family N-acetyltransferase [Tannerella sp.]|jgi:ribosomal protein S18 acetylase RimI-like enzyme|nr:GNAT family N-acetyltransferase [Tannerella sp.]
MKPEITIRPCDYTDTNDRNAIGTLINAYIKDEMGGGIPLNPMQETQLAEALKQHPKTIVLMACIDETRCGMLVAFENFSTFTVCPMINIHDVIVLKEYRGNGIGRKLLEYAVNIARQRRCNRITLEVREDNIIAQRLYKTLGFHAPEPGMYYWRKYL